jgi:hypothetical protein
VDFVLADKNKKAGAKVQRPVPSRIALPFGEHFEEFLMSWNFLVVYGYVLSCVKPSSQMLMTDVRLLVNHYIYRHSLWTNLS